MTAALDLRAATPSPVAPAGATVARRAATHGVLLGRSDAWLLGGLSVVLWGGFAVARLVGSDFADPAAIARVATFVQVAALFVNYPHFMASYRLAYTAGPDLRRRRWGTLVVIPVVLVASCVVGFATFDRLLVVGPLEVTDVGRRAMTALIHVMFFTVGWHYVKQTYGCVRVAGKFRSFSFSPGEARVLKYSLFPLGATPFVASNVGDHGFEFYGLAYQSLGLPRPLQVLTHAALIVGLVASVAVFGRVAWRERRPPPIVVAIPMLAIYVWWSPLTYHPAFALAVPMFHSLQYLPFVAKLEARAPSARARSDRARIVRYGAIAAGLVVCGWAAFSSVPRFLDGATDVSGAAAVQFFVLAFAVSINIHHYFIDHVIWRLDDPRLRDRLLAA